MKRKASAIHNAASAVSGIEPVEAPGKIDMKEKEQVSDVELL